MQTIVHQYQQHLKNLKSSSAISKKYTYRNICFLLNALDDVHILVT